MNNVCEAELRGLNSALHGRCAYEVDLDWFWKASTEMLTSVDSEFCETRVVNLSVVINWLELVKSLAMTDKMHSRRHRLTLQSRTDRFVWSK